MGDAQDDRTGLLAKRFRPLLIAFFLRARRTAAEAEDLTQDVLLKMLDVSPADVRNVDAYVYSVAGNVLRDRVRRDRVRDGWRIDEGNRAPHADYVDPLRQLESRERLRRVARALGDLSPRSRDILLLFRLEKMRKRDIAESFGISVSGVDKHLIRATAHLTRQLSDIE